MKVLDLTANEKASIRYVMPGEITLDVLTPTKATKDLFSSLGEALIRVGKKQGTDEDIENIFGTTALILSRNKQGKTFTKNELENMFDTDDVVNILLAYADFLTETIKSKN